MKKQAEYKQLELKICERCGGLWLRPSGKVWVYCGPCLEKMNELPRAAMKGKRCRQEKCSKLPIAPETVTSGGAQ